MRILKVNCNNGMLWVTTINLWICDESHTDTVSAMFTNTKPTERQLRKFKKDAKKSFRFGTREQQRMLRGTMRGLA